MCLEGLQCHLTTYNRVQMEVLISVATNTIENYNLAILS